MAIANANNAGKKGKTNYKTTVQLLICVENFVNTRPCKIYQN